MSRFLAFVAGFGLVSAIGAFAAAIWTSGDLSTRLGATSGLLACVAVLTGTAAALLDDDI